MNNFDDLTDLEESNFRQLNRNVWPNSQLENNLVAELKNLGLIHSQQPRTYLLWPVSIAASIVFFLLGAYWSAQPENPHYNYMLLLHNTLTFSNDGTVKEYAEWIQSLQEKGLIVDGEKLQTTAQVVTLTGVSKVDQSSHSDYVSGYFLLSANTREEALKVVESNPHIKCGGTIELRQIVKN